MRVFDSEIKVPFWIVVVYVTVMFVAVIYGLSAPGCAKDTQGMRAIEIPSPVNTVCYAIVDESGRSVGGNCLWAK